MCVIYASHRDPIERRHTKKYETVSMNVGKRNLVTRLVGLSELESISIDDGVGARDK